MIINVPNAGIKKYFNGKQPCSRCCSKCKVMEAMKSSDPVRTGLNAKVEVDEFFIGGQEEGKHRRGNKKKHLVAMAIQVYKFGIPARLCHSGGPARPVRRASLLRTGYSITRPYRATGIF